MSSFVDAVRDASDFVHSSRAAYDTDGAAPTRGILASAIGNVENFLSASSTLSVKDVPALMDAIRNLNGVGIDDREYLLEKLVLLMSRMPDNEGLGQKMQQFFISTLYKDLPHPPASFLGPVNNAAASTAPVPDKPRYAFRTDDGSNYSLEIPSLGMAGSPYARTVMSSSTKPVSALPDPGLLFDLLLRRDPNEAPKPHPGGLSAMFFAVANLVIHSIFDTDHRDWRINNTSSYMDLAPLYGGGAGMQATKVEQMRTLDGTGKLWEDTFADSRLLFMPPATACVLILLNRNHNYVADMILSLNENGTYQNPPPADEKARRAQDDEIFHRARLVNSGYFAKIVLHDYVGGILGLTRDGSAWRLNLTQQFRDSEHEMAPVGRGGAVSCEFNTLYRWHTTTSEPDAEWIGDVFKDLFPNKDMKEVTPRDFAMAVGHKFAKETPKDVRQWEFGGLKRGPDGRFSDEDISSTIYAAINTPAHAFGARSTPECMRVIEIMTIQQNRMWGTCTLNEFRRFFGLRPWANFKEWNPDPAINEAAQALYGDIEHLELHVGLQAEASKPPMPGAGLCPGYTVSRAILADAVVLTRSDRFLTNEMTPFNLTAWGYNFVNVDPKDGSYGGMFSKLLLRELPAYFKPGEGHAHFPLMVPAEMKMSLETKHPRGVAEKYTWNMPPPSTVAAAQAPPSPALKYQMNLSSLLGSVKVDRSLVDDILFSDANLAKWADDFARTTKELIEERSVYNPSWKTRHVDIIQDVINLVPIHFLASEILGLPLKTEANPGGVYRDTQLHGMFVDISNYLLANQDPSEEFSLREKALKATNFILNDIEGHLARHTWGIFSWSGLVDTIKLRMAGKTDRSDSFMKAVLDKGTKQGYTHQEIAASLFAEVAAAAAPYSANLGTIVDHYLDKANGVTLAASGHVDSKSVRSALGSALPRFASTRAYLGEDGLLHPKFFEKTASAVLSVIFNLKGINRVPGASGKLDKFALSFGGKPQQFYTDNHGKVTSFPARLDVQYAANA